MDSTSCADLAWCFIFISLIEVMTHLSKKYGCVEGMAHQSKKYDCVRDFTSASHCDGWCRCW